jgi:hypothetical protein
MEETDTCPLEDPAMRLPRVRFTVRRMVVAVAAVYLIAIGLQWGRGVYVEVFNHTSDPLRDVRLVIGDGAKAARFPRIEPGRSAGLYVPRRTPSLVSFSYEKPDGVRDGESRIAIPPLSDNLLEPKVRIGVLKGSLVTGRNGFYVRRRRVYDPSAFFGG